MLPSPSDSDASSPQKSSSGVSTTAQQLEQSIIDDVNAVNARDFSREGPLFRRKASYWVAEVTAGLASKTLTCEEFVEAIKARTTAHPNYKLRAIDFATTVDERNGHAEIFANMEVSGGWDGVVVPNVTVCEYHKIDGKVCIASSGVWAVAAACVLNQIAHFTQWYHVAHRTMPGMDPNMLR